MKLTRRSFSRLVAAAPLASGFSSEAPALVDAPKLKELLEPIRAKYELPALIGGIVTTEGLSKVAVTGVRVAGGTTEATIHDLWHLGSNTKAMTSSLMGTLVEEGKVHWDDTLASLLPEVAGLKTSDLGAVTISQLLHHTSGLIANLKWGVIAANGGSMMEQRLAALDEAIKTPLTTAPGKAYLYSNTGYMLAGLVIEKVTGKAWEDAIKERLFTPLGMLKVGFGGIGTPGKDDQPWPHLENGTPLSVNGPKVDNPPVMGPAGIVHASLTEWAKFIADHLKGGHGDKALLQPATYAVLHKPGLQDYAMGWISAQRSWAGGAALTHSGSNTMNYCVAWLAPAKGFAVIACTNRGLQTQPVDEAVGAIIKHHLGTT